MTHKFEDTSLDSYDEKFMVCREAGNHSWEKSDWEVDERNGTFGVAKIRRCIYCPVKRYDIYNTRGERIAAPRYIYPDGYQIKGGGFKPVDFRAESIARAGIRHLRPVEEVA